MVNTPLTPTPSPRTKNDDVLILQMDMERRQKREDIKRSVPWRPAYQEQISAPVLLDEDCQDCQDCQGAKRQCIRDETEKAIPYRSSGLFFTLQPRNLNATFQNCDAPRIDTDYYIREPPVPISPC
ncbi:MAG: hypothetical protein SGBAC_002112 [Bacillariaceae sp.]